MAGQEKTSFLKSRAFILILIWLALGGVLTAAIYAARPSMEHACEVWAEDIEVSDEHHGADHDPCHTVAAQGQGLTRNLAAAMGGIVNMPLATAWNVPNFLILITLLWHFAKDPVNENLKKRKKELDDSIAEARQKREEAEKAKAEYERRLQEIDKEIEKVRQEMRDQGEFERNKILEAASEQTKRIQRDADFTANQELSMAQYKLREEAARLSVQVAEKVIRETINKDDRERLVDEYLEKVMERGK